MLVWFLSWIVCAAQSLTLARQKCFIRSCFLSLCREKKIVPIYNNVLLFLWYYAATRQRLQSKLIFSFVLCCKNKTFVINKDIFFRIVMLWEENICDLFWYFILFLLLSRCPLCSWFQRLWLSHIRWWHALVQTPTQLLLSKLAPRGALVIWSSSFHNRKLKVNIDKTDIMPVGSAWRLGLVGTELANTEVPRS